MRRAFSLLELTLAAAIAGVILAAALGVFGMMDRSERGLALRFDDIGRLERAQLVVKRAMESLALMHLTAEEAKESGEPPRFELVHVPGPVMPEPSFATGTEIVMDERQAQRLALTLTSAPVVSPDLSILRELREGAVETGASSDGLVRGVFELAPDRTVEGSEEWTWSLFWREIRDEPEEGESEAVTRPERILVIDGIRACRWLVYQDHQQKAAYSTSAVVDLPAYVTLEVELMSGLSAQWMFEISWQVVAPAEASPSGASETPVPNRPGAPPRGATPREGTDIR